MLGEKKSLIKNLISPFWQHRQRVPYIRHGGQCWQDDIPAGWARQEDDSVEMSQRREADNSRATRCHAMVFPKNHSPAVETMGSLGVDRDSLESLVCQKNGRKNVQRSINANNRRQTIRQTVNIWAKIQGKNRARKWLSEIVYLGFF